MRPRPKPGDSGRAHPLPAARSSAVSTNSLPRLVGINHVALEVDDIDQAIAYYGQLFEFTLRGRSGGAAFIDIGDQFIALTTGRSQPPDRARHLGLVIDDKQAARRALERAGAEILPGRGLDFRDPWGNRIQLVQYDEIQFTKAPAVLRGMRLEHLSKTPAAREELRRKGLIEIYAEDSG